VKRKILAAFLLALIAIGLALTITHFSFKEMMVTVGQLSTPNEKLIRLSKVFEEITMLDQHQRAEAIQNPTRPYKYFLDQSGFVHLMIDSLQMLPWDSVQSERLESMQRILDQRNQIFVSYMKVKAELADNKEFSQQLDTLSAILRANQENTDSIVTTQRKTITHFVQKDSIKAAAKDRGFLKKLFGKKKEQPETADVKVQEEVKVDTLTVTRGRLDLAAIEKMMRGLEKDQLSQRKRLQNKELELIEANSLFINEILHTLREVEKEEMEIVRASNQQAAKVVSQGISNMNIIVVAFFLSAAMLIYFILIDISRSNYYRIQLEKARDEAEELTKIKQRFLANMSHEIRTPLQSIIGFAELLKQGHGDNRDAVQAIHSSSEHLLQIVNEVLDYSRITSGNFSLVKENFKVLTVVKEVESAMRIQAHRKNLTFILDTEKAVDHFVSGDSFRLRQILYNLLGNAIKFTHKGFIKLAVTTHQSADITTCTFEITDTGIGMSEEEVNKIFHQFEQANPGITKTYGGTGLGLSIVKSLVDFQHGTLDVHSQPGTGSSFKVTLSFSPAEDAVKHFKPEKATSKPAAKVIVIDDDVLIIKLCSLIFSKNKIEHHAFSDAEEALHVKYDPDVSHILVDIRMPKMNGVKLCNELKKKFSQHTLFVALTAHVLPDERDRLLEQGFDFVLPKPFHESDLLQILGVRMNGVSITEDALPDFSALRKMTMGDEMLFQSVMQQFLEESEDDLIRIGENLRTENRKALREIVHKMAGRFGQMGIHQLSAKLHDVELDLVDGKTLNAIKPVILEVVKETSELMKTIRLSQLIHPD
jgi:signal transduction histidine kinase/CheY-like chemotaxis protein